MPQRKKVNPVVEAKDYLVADTPFGAYEAMEQGFGEAMFNALVDHRFIVILYTDEKGETTRRLIMPTKIERPQSDPIHGPVLVQAVCARAIGYRTFRLDRILGIEGGPESV